MRSSGMMNQNEYNHWITKMRLLGELEQQRKEDERADPNGLKQFLFFLDQIHAMWRKSGNPILDDMSETNVRIARQRILSNYPLR